MAGELDLTPSQTSWALNAQAIAAILAVSTTARLADIFGHRRLLVPLMVIGTVGSVLAAIADGFVMLCLGRAMIGFAIAAPMAWAMLKSKADAKGLQQAALMTGMVISFCTPLALVLGGVLLEAGWAWSQTSWALNAQASRPSSPCRASSGSSPRSNLGYALVAASGRQNNMSLTFGMQYAASAPFGALAVAIMFVVLSSSSTVIPGTEVAVPSEGMFTANFLWMAGAAFVLYVVQGLIFAPKQLNQHEIVLDTPGIAAATPDEVLTVPTDDDTADVPRRRFDR